MPNGVEVMNASPDGEDAARALILESGSGPSLSREGPCKAIGRTNALHRLRSSCSENCRGISAIGLAALALAAILFLLHRCFLAVLSQGGNVDLRALGGHHGPGAKPPRITFIVAETRGRPLLSLVGNFGNHFGQVVNIGVNRTWDSFETKIKLLDEYLRAQVSLVGYEPPGEAERHIVAFADGGDIIWGGCPPEDFRRNYDRIVEASGASIIFSSEVVCGEQDCNQVPDVPRWAGELAGVSNLSGDFWNRYAVGCKGTWNTECAAKRDCGYGAPCSQPPSMKFLNSGFVMGPVKDMAEMVAWTRKHYHEFSVWGDQSVFAMYWLRHQHRVTLDYTGELALSISDMDYQLLHVNPETGEVRNVAFNRVQCMIHGNGRGRDFLQYLVSLMEHKPFKAVRGY